MSKTATRMEIPIDKIKISPYQPRLTFNLDDLLGSIKKNGILVDLLVRKKTDYFELIDGERRLRVSKQLGLSHIPCKIVDVDDETAMGMVYTINQDREDYSLRENVRYAILLLGLNQNITSIAEKMRRSRPQVRDYLNVDKLPKNYQEYLWANKFGIGHLHEVSGLFNGGGASIALKHLDVVLERKLTRDEFRKYLRPYLIDVEEKRVDSAKKAAGEIELDFKEPETAEEFEKAADTLKKKARALKTPEQILKEKREKARASLLNGKGNTLSRIEKAKSLDIDISGYEKRLHEIETKIDDDPAGAYKESTSLKKTLNNVIKKEEQRLREQEIRREAAEAERKRIEAEAKAAVEAEKERLRIDAEAELEAEKERLKKDPKFIAEVEREIIRPPIPRIIEKPKKKEYPSDAVNMITIGLSPNIFSRLTKFMERNNMMIDSAVNNLLSKALETEGIE